ncbi:MAG: DEAD/DEAH box helicase [Saprospiraceae bacterium]
MAPLQPKTATHDLAYRWFSRQGWHPFLFQEQAWQEFEWAHGLVNAPTGSGKTYSLFIPIALNYLEAGCPPGLFAIWVTPIRALTKEIYNACSRAAMGWASKWRLPFAPAIPTKKNVPVKNKSLLPY